MIDALFLKSYPQIFTFFNTLWKEGSPSTGFPQEYVDKLWKSRAHKGRNSAADARL